ncbi:MAG: tetratricopeptide repeat protein [Bacteroidales bacterium]|jgi:tetratricopeptide (TPR) repeat protein|nr:tetratricopeptide repeat protein [Bacteroidales bacterium]
MKIKTTFISAKLMIMSLILCFCAVNANSQSAEEWFDNGTSALAKSDFQKAIECYEKAVELKPDYAVAYYIMGFAYEEGKQDYKKAVECYEKVIECCKKAVEYEPENAGAYSIMGAAYDKIGNDKKAKECYKKAEEFGDEAAKQLFLDRNIE